jgi:hypothetical protein
MNGIAELAISTSRSIGWRTPAPRARVHSLIVGMASKNATGRPDV